ncbi:sensor domain-containing protein [Streptomyces sp. NBC_00335]|uniref:sensor histidine kinase n=1 Tax=unclassified Streptomyces TaxID=2593676 RepID=UPI0022506017|nr:MULTISPECIES: sensor histidine kinase [unclassified Streptomyces]MCX5404857.1 sensor domain-containing protein [Streptomyces sp. NBC_00086]
MPPNFPVPFPGRYLRSARPWRAVGYLLGGAVTGALALTLLTLLAVCGTALAVVLVGLPLLGALALAGVPFAAVERRRLRLLDPGSAPLPDPHRDPDRTGLAAWARTRFREQATWRELGYAVLAATLLWPLELLAVGALLLPVDLLATPVLLALDGERVNPLKIHGITGYPQALLCAAAGLLLLPLLLYGLGAAAAARAALARLMLGPAQGDLAVQVTELTSSRARLAAAFDAERRRIERDLHDGAQQRLVALSMTLGLARLDAPPGSALAGQLAAAHAEAGQALTSLRELVHGIHPQVLTDRGLPDAVADLADRSPIPVDTDVDLPGRLPEQAESAGYFFVSEALANAAKHSGAGRITVTGRHDGTRLALEVADDGRGGADAGRGSGLTGLADRVSVVDGRLTLTSPPGGPTLLRVEIPCVPKAPKAPKTAKTPNTQGAA